MDQGRIETAARVLQEHYKVDAVSTCRCGFRADEHLSRDDASDAYDAHVMTVALAAADAWDAAHGWRTVQLQNASIRMERVTSRRVVEMSCDPRRACR
jgi:hypothetical protein